MRVKLKNIYLQGKVPPKINLVSPEEKDGHERIETCWPDEYNGDEESDESDDEYQGVASRKKVEEACQMCTNWVTSLSRFFFMVISAFCVFLVGLMVFYRNKTQKKIINHVW
jgi:hypothetical protein